MGEWVTLIGTASIQEYLFRSNRLRENAGASWIVAQALNEWEKDHRGGQLIYVGGGNAALRFPSRDAAVAAVREWSIRLLREYPGLRVVAAHQEVRQQGQDEALQRARQELFLRENAPASGAPLGALPVVRPCASTGTAAARQDKFGTWLSDESLAKTAAVKQANPLLCASYRDALDCGGLRYTFPLDMSRLGIAAGASQVALVHADGNGFGDLIANAGANIGELSSALTRLGRSAFLRALSDLARHLPALKKSRDLNLQPVEHDEDSADASGAQFYFPVRPLVDGGDDLTFVCHGRLGLRLATAYLRNLEEQSKALEPLTGKPKLSACAGVLIMPQKFPFARAYKLVEQLTARAKMARRYETPNREVSWIDFQILLEGSAGSLDALRAGYRSGEDVLLQRPYCLTEHPARSWTAFSDLFQHFRMWPRNRAKRLLEALARGRQETQPRRRL